MEVFTAITDYYNYFMTDLSDPRTKTKFLMSSPLPTLGLIAVYLIIIKFILPQHMKKRPAYNLKSTLMYYNWFQMIFSAVIMYQCFASGYVRRFSLFKCRDLDQSTTDPDALLALSASYLYFLAKFTEFFDTIFFILRNKSNQVSFLHVFHHASMPLNAFMMARIYPGGSCTLVAGVNSSVHVVMYTYYMLSGLGPRWQKYLWWKKYLTTFQLVQFTAGLILTFPILIDQSNCPAFRKRYVFVIYTFIYIFVLLFLFYRFYKQTYATEQKRKQEQKVQKIK